jgi:thymidylate synthase (FAD)
MMCQLIHYTPIWLASHACRMSTDSHDKSDTCFHNEVDFYENHSYHGTKAICRECGYEYNQYEERLPPCGEKDFNLIERVGFKLKHESILEMFDFVWDIEMSTKTLLAMSRHRIGVSLTMRSTRYTTKKRKGQHQVQSTDKTKEYLHRIMAIVDEAIETGISDDELSLLLPQSYIYRGQVKMNGRSLKHFLGLRLEKSAHFQIRQMAQDMFDTLPNEYKKLYSEFAGGKDDK